MNARSYRDTDRAGAERLLEWCWPADPLMRQLHDLHGAATDEPWSRTLVVERDGELIAAGTARLGRRHPARYWLVLNVVPEWRGRGIGSHLLAELRALTAHDPRPFRAQVRPSHTEAMRFLRHHSFRPKVQTWEGVINPHDSQVGEALASIASGAPRFRMVQPRGEELKGKLLDIASFYEDWYHAIHRWDPPVRWAIEESLAHFCGPDLVANSVTCMYRDDELVGAGSLITPPFQGGSEELYLVQLGVLGVEPAEARGLTARLVADCLAFAAREGKLVRFEVDDTHTELWAVLSTIPLLASECDFMILADDEDERCVGVEQDQLSRSE